MACQVKSTSKTIGGSLKITIQFIVRRKDNYTIGRLVSGYEGLGQHRRAAPVGGCGYLAARARMSDSRDFSLFTGSTADDGRQPRRRGRQEKSREKDVRNLSSQGGAAIHTHIHTYHLLTVSILVHHELSW